MSAQLTAMLGFLSLYLGAFAVLAGVLLVATSRARIRKQRG
jgi:hypothetical protein